jgi:hypothetical protein
MSGEGEDRRMGMAGLVTCGSPTCPCCATKVGAHRAQEISDTLRLHRDDHWLPELRIGGGACLITLMLRHNLGQTLVFLPVVLRYGWSRVPPGRRTSPSRPAPASSGGSAPWRSPGRGVNGWHPHLHIVVLTDTPVSDEHARDLGERWLLRWERALGRRDVQSLMDSGGLDVRNCDLSDLSTGALADYLSKVGREVAGSYAKKGRDGSFSIFGLLREVIASYEVQAFGAWEQLERTVKGGGYRFLTWSKGAQAGHPQAGHQAGRRR